MDIKEAIEKKEQLEKKIEELIEEFTLETNLDVYSIDLEEGHCMGQMYSVELDVRLT
jgi:hypothetical protein